MERREVERREGGWRGKGDVLCVYMQSSVSLMKFMGATYLCCIVVTVTAYVIGPYSAKIQPIRRLHLAYAQDVLAFKLVIQVLMVSLSTVPSLCGWNITPLLN